MSEEINLNKIVFRKTQYSKVIDTSFNELGVKTIQEQLDEQPNIEEFFSLYNELFYDIPELGATNSHEFLIKQSSEYIDFDETNEIIEELQKEISQLRTELLDSQKRVVELETGTSLEENGGVTLNGEGSSVSGGSTSVGGGSGGGSGGGGGY